MGEYVVLVPEQLNDGSPVSPTLVGMLETDALALFGGFTVYPTVRGAWRDDSTGTVYREPMVPYHVASDKPTRVKVFAEQVGLMLDQLAVYVRNPDGSVHFVDTRPAV